MGSEPPSVPQSESEPLEFFELIGGDSDDVVGFEYRVICGDGSVHWLQWNSRIMPERGVVFGVGRDVTDRRRANTELRALAHGILPAALTRGGLRKGVEALASRSPVPVTTGVSVGRLPATVEATAYFVVAEALTNVAKHARASRAEVTARIEDGTLAVQVCDDGTGGARPDGSGLLGLADRLAAVDGKLRVESLTDGGTLIAAAIPIRGSAPELPS